MRRSPPGYTPPPYVPEITPAVLVVLEGTYAHLPTTVAKYDSRKGDFFCQTLCELGWKRRLAGQLGRIIELCGELEITDLTACERCFIEATIATSLEDLEL